MPKQLIFCLSLAMVVSFAGCEAKSTMKTLNEVDKIVFIGDSITAYENWNTLFGVTYIRNAGIPENTTDDVLSRLSSIISSKPEKIFLFIGINDLFGGKDTSYISANYETILNKIRLESPDTILYFQSVLPTNSDISLSASFESNNIPILQ